MCIIKIGEGLGFLTPEDILATAGTIQFTSDLSAPGLIFHVQGSGFSFHYWGDGKTFICERNGTHIRVPAEIVASMVERAGHAHVKLAWGPSSMCIAMALKRKKWAEWTQGAETIPTVPPSDLVAWARRQNLVRKVQFASVGEFCSRTYALLQSVNKTVSQMDSVNLFWDIQRQGNKIVSRTPKAEPDVQPFISAILQDQVLVAGMDLVSEYTTGVGNLDFMFTGSVTDSGLGRMCTEIKNG